MRSGWSADSPRNLCSTSSANATSTASGDTSDTSSITAVPARFPQHGDSAGDRRRLWCQALEPRANALAYRRGNRQRSSLQRRRCAPVAVLIDREQMVVDQCGHDGTDMVRQAARLVVHERRDSVTILDAERHHRPDNGFDVRRAE